MNRRAGSCSVTGAAGDARIRQVRSAAAEVDLIDVEPKPIGGDLRERRPRSLSHIVRADLDCSAVGADFSSSLGLEHQGGECGRTDAPSRQQPFGVPH